MQTVRDVMTTNVEYCTPLDNVYEVAVKMKDLNVGAIPICEDEKLIGMITDRDLVIRGYAEKRSGSFEVTGVMSSDLTTVKPETTLEEATRIMAEKQIRRLPVVDNGHLVGIVALGDLAVNQMSDERAGHALSEISEPAHPTH
ncbi:CBS domain-containing protein [Bacillus mesophilus]|uniref:CBS domain-containing protein n=1 Tax=Bacillus mesophilus TaxID=1808955 RepID=A0A6M0Q269_9BACI|nr:CBS domain-containing protein [Bacillus mesophilus]MBM7659493.1 CBS domain-containing protein [Bacillus mesophilus]NEY70366.1 CBS domain-containing protein [Bacillus mesophilus]